MKNSKLLELLKACLQELDALSLEDTREKEFAKQLKGVFESAVIKGFKNTAKLLYQLTDTLKEYPIRKLVEPILYSQVSEFSADPEVVFPMSSIPILIELGVGVNTTNLITESTFIKKAISQGNVEVANYLIEKGAHLPECLSGFLDKAIDHSDLEMVKWLVKQGACIDGEPFQKRPLIRALEKMYQLNGQEITKFLLSSGANTNILKGVEFNNASRRKLDDDLVKQLTQAGCNIQNKSPSKTTFKSKCYKRKRLKPKYTLEDIKGISRDTYDQYLKQAANEGDLDTFEFLVKHNDEVTIDFDGCLRNLITSLFIRMGGYTQGGFEWIKLLLRCGADVNAKYENGLTPLHICQEGLIKSLCSARADVNIKDKNGWPPLHYRCYYGSSFSSGLDKLLDCGVDVMSMTEGGLTPLHLAAIKADESHLQLFIERGAQIDAESLEGEILEKGCQTRYSKDTPLTLAYKMGRCETARALVEHGADIHAKDRASLWSAIYWGDLKGVRLLISHGIDIHSPYRYGGELSLHYAIEKLDLEIVKCLVQSGANIEATDADGRTAFLLACAFGAKDREMWHEYKESEQVYDTREIAYFLMRCGADVNVKDRYCNGYGVLDYLDEARYDQFQWHFLSEDFIYQLIEHGSKDAASWAMNLNLPVFAHLKTKDGGRK